MPDPIDFTALAISADGDVRICAENMTTAERGYLSPLALMSSTWVFQNTSPSSGSTIDLANDSRNRFLAIRPMTTLTSLTVDLPSDGSSALGQIIRIFTSQDISTFTLTGATTIYNNATSLVAGDVKTYSKVAANEWALF